MKIIKVYFSCPLTGMSEEYKQSTFSLREAIRNIPYVTILDFHQPNTGETQSAVDDGEVYDNDIHNSVAVADAIVSDLTYASFGVGYELGVAIEKFRMPTFMCKKRSNEISKIAKGSAVRNRHVKLMEYDTSPKELLQDIELFLRSVAVQKS